MPEGDTLLRDVLLDQRVACGIGNVYKSEVLFIEGWIPHTTLAQVGDDVLRERQSGAPVHQGHELKEMI